MAWNTCNLMDNRTEFVTQALKIENGEIAGTFTGLCQQFGISRKTGYKWLRRYREGGKANLVDRSRTPHHCPHKTPKTKEDKVLELRSKHPSWGGRKLNRRLVALGEDSPPAGSTISGILDRHNLLNREDPSAGPKSWQRFERAHPNDLWQMDFKGHFGLSNGQRCHPLTITDDHSRFNICLRACSGEDSATVKKHLIETFQRYGLPNQILSDNASYWSCSKRGGALSQLEAWLIRIEVEPIHGRPRHPQTQGKEERFHKTLDLEVIKSRLKWDHLEQCEEAFIDWRIVYNEQRPHESLDDDVPLSRYEPSLRPYVEANGERDMCEYYEENEPVRKVDRSGEISYLGKRYYVGYGLCGERVVIRSYSENHSTVTYGWKQLGKIDLTVPKGTRNPLKKISNPKKKQ